MKTAVIINKVAYTAQRIVTKMVINATENKHQNLISTSESVMSDSKLTSINTASQTV